MAHTYSVEAGKIKLCRAKRKALEIIEGSHAKSYAKLSSYTMELRNTNPGSLLKIKTDIIPPNFSKPTFRRMFISFTDIQIGFKDAGNL